MNRLTEVFKATEKVRWTKTNPPFIPEVHAYQEVPNAAVPQKTTGRFRGKPFKVEKKRYIYSYKKT